ncbi:MAG: pre-peptidase C-terminal domain-containing protein [Candidatus Hydrogenedentes bacterium]|nr:pre-peptidase C-terminal domain-containing protein [Candidatus Hydrogenedentota bacterium]
MLRRRLCWIVVAALLLARGALGELTFEGEILPIFKSHCSACHFPPVDPPKGKLDLSTLAGTLKGGSEGVILVAGKAEESRLIQMIEGKLEPKMPPEGKGEPLGVDSIALLKQWINDGAKGQDAPAAPTSTSAPQAASAPNPATIQPPISAMAYGKRGDELLLASGTLHNVELFTVDAQGQATSKGKLEGHAEMVRALAFNAGAGVLAAGGGKPGRGGEIKLWNTSDLSLIKTIEGHKDNVLALAFSPDGKQLVSASYDKSLIVWDVETGNAVRTLANHVDAVYAVAWSPDGKQIASGAGDRTVKLWQASDGKLLITISDSLDAVLALAFAPDGNTLAGAGADKVIRLWEMVGAGEPLEQSGSTAGKLKTSTFAHEGAILHIIYSPDGSTLYSTAEDRRIKAWDSAALTEKVTFEHQSDWVTALALDPQGALLAAGRYDATRTIYATETGKALSGSTTQVASAQSGPKKVTSLSVEAVIIRATVPPSLQSVSPDRWHRGAELELAVNGKNLDRAEPISTNPKVNVEIAEVEALPEPELKLGEGPRGTGADILDNARPYKMKLKVKTEADAPLGRYEILFRTPIGLTNGAGFTIIPAPDLSKAEPNDESPQPVQWPGVVEAAINASGDVDKYNVSAKAGQEIVFVITDSALNVDMQLRDPSGDVVATGADFGGAMRSRMGYKVPADGDYVVEVADADLRANLGYRLHIGAFPMVTSVWPLGVHAGVPQKVEVAGFNLPGTTVEVDPPDEAAPGATMPLPIAVPEGSPISLPVLSVSGAADASEVEPNNSAAEAQPLAFPAAINARIAHDKDGVPDVDYYHFHANKDQAIVIETLAAKFGSKLDSKIEVLDAQGNPLQRALLRCVAQTALTLSPRDSRQAGLRFENWRDFKMNDYVMVGGEVIQVSRIPGYGDEDVVFKQYPNGQRIGLFATTPEHHAVYDHIYKVTVHPVGTTFAPNGMPVYPLFWKNDDAFDANGNATGDSRLDFVAPEDGDYVVRVSDVRGEGGPNHAYRLLLRELKPDFAVAAAPYHISMPPGSRIPLDVRVLRTDGFNEEVKVTAHGLPEGFTVETESVLPDEDLVRVALVAGPDAKTTPFDSRFKLTGEANVSGTTVTREAYFGSITVSEKQPDLTVNNGENTLVLAPGQLGAISLNLTKANGYDSRTPISVLNLPFGVRVMYTGLNGILVREGETERRIEILAEPWVKPMTRRIYVQANIETQSPQRPVFLGEPIELRIVGDQKLAKRN